MRVGSGRRGRRGVARVVGTALAAALVLSGCQFKGVSSLPLPGGAATFADTYEVVVILDNAIDLVPQSSVRVDEVPVGDVKSIELDGFRAKVTCRVKTSVTLPANAVASLRQTSLLGEKYIALSPPAKEKPTGRLKDGDVIPVDRTNRLPEVEEVFGALSALLNGGGLQQLQTINVELSAALAGNEAQVRDFLTQLNTFIGGLDARKSEIVRALDSLDRLSTTLVRQKQTIATALTDIAPGLKVLADERADLTRLLQSLARLGEVGSRVIRESRDDTVADLRALVPILQRLVQAGTFLPQSLELLLTYPFPKNVTDGIFGDYTGLRATLDVQSTLTNLNAILANMGAPSGGAPVPVPVPPLPGVPQLPASPTTPTVPGVPTPPVPSLPGIPSVPGVPLQPQGGPSDLGTLLGGGLQ